MNNACQKTSWVLAAWLAAPFALAQEEPAPAADLGFETLGNGLRYRCVEVPGASGICAVLGWRVGTDHDPEGATGLASAVGEALRRAQSGLPLPRQCSVAVRGPVTTLTGVAELGGSFETAELADLADLLQRLRRFLAGELDIDDDLAVRAAGGAALEADSQTHIVPGTALRWTARRALLAGTPAGRQGIGIPAHLKRVEPAGLRARYRELYRPRNALLVLCGGASEEEMAGALRAALGDLPAGEHPAPAPAVHDVLGAPPTRAVLDRVAAPYVTLALRAPEPSDPEYLPFAVGMAVVSARAARVLRNDRGRESWGRFPRVFFEFTEGGRVAFVNRRARDGDGAEAPREEIEKLVDRLYADGAWPDEIAPAIDLVARQWQLPPYPDPAAATGVATSARALYGPASTLLMAEILGWPPDVADRVRALPPARVDEVLRASLAPARRTWFELVPPT